MNVRVGYWNGPVGRLMGFVRLPLNHGGGTYLWLWRFELRIGVIR